MRRPLRYLIVTLAVVAGMSPLALALVLVTTLTHPAPATRGTDAGRSYLPLAVGDTWKMADQAGRVTSFAVLADDRPNTVRLRITKDDAKAYWWAGVNGAWLDFYLTWEGDTWRSTRSDVHLPGSSVAVEPVAVAGQPAPYQLYPAGGKVGAITTTYDLATVDCSTCPMPHIEWRTDSYMTTLPGFGEVLATHYCEGVNCANAEETWYFQRGVGLVQLHDVFKTDLKLSRLPA